MEKIMVTLTKTFTSQYPSELDKIVNQWLIKQMKNADTNRFKVISITSYACSVIHTRSIVFEALVSKKEGGNENE